MKLYTCLSTILFIALSCVGSAFAVDSWRTFSNPFPIRSAVAYGNGVMLATDGGIRYRAGDVDKVYHSDCGLETSTFYALAVKYGLGIYAVSEYGLVAKLNADDETWRVLNRSYVSNGIRVVPDGAVIAEPILTIAFEDRLAFFDVVHETSVLTIDRIRDKSLSVNPIEKIAVSGDTLYVDIGGNAYARKMDWSDLKGDVLLNDPSTWLDKGDISRVAVLADDDSDIVRVEEDTLGLPDLFDSTGGSLVSRVKWVEKTGVGYYLVGSDLVELYNGDARHKSFANLSEYAGYTLGEAYEIKAMPVIGGAFAASPNGNIAYTNAYGWNYNIKPFYSGSLSTAYANRMKTISALPDGHVLFHAWGLGYIIFSNWGAAVEKIIPAGGDYCLDNYLNVDTAYYTISVATTPAPDSSGFLTVTGSNDGYSVAYITKEGEISCAKHVGKRVIAGPMYATTAEDGSWVIYLGSREGMHIGVEGDLDVIRFPAPKTNGGELSNGELKTYYGLSLTPIDIAYDPVGKRLWLITMSTLAYLDESQDTLISPTSTNGLRGLEYTSLDVDVHGNLWLGTADQGAFRLTPKKKSPDTLSVKSFDSRSGLLSNDVSDLSVDPVLGAVWFAHSNGVSVYFRNDLKDASTNMTDSASADVVAYPIPFRPKIHSHFTIDHIAEDAVVSIFNRGGALIRSFRNDEVLGGKLEWDGMGKDGRLVAPGVYYYVVNTSSKTKKGKFIIIH